MKMFHDEIVLEMADEMKKCGFEFDERLPGDHAQTSDDVIIMMRFKVVKLTEFTTRDKVYDLT